MFDIPLLKACVRQQQVVEEVLSLNGHTPDREALADAVQLFASYADLLDRAQRRLLFKAATAGHPETAAVGSLLTALVQSALATGSRLRQEIGSAGTAVERADDLDKALGRLERLLELHLRDWPREALPGREEVLSAQRRGETETLDAAFGEIAGLDPAEWERRVEEQRRKKQNLAAG